MLVDQSNKVLVWGLNSNGEVGVGDSQIRKNPTYLESIFDKKVYQVSVGSCFAFGIGDLT